MKIRRYPTISVLDAEQFAHKYFETQECDAEILETWNREFEYVLERFAQDIGKNCTRSEPELWTYTADNPQEWPALEGDYYYMTFLNDPISQYERLVTSGAPRVEKDKLWVGCDIWETQKLRSLPQPGVTMIWPATEEFAHKTLPWHDISEKYVLKGIIHCEL